MELSCLLATSRSVALRLFDGGLYHTEKPYRVTVNGRDALVTDRVITSLYGLWPDTEYVIGVWDGATQLAAVAIHTEAESYTLDVRRFGAVGDGLHNDTAAIQAAIACCPAGGRVLIPKGTYCVSPLFLKSHITIEWQEGAELWLSTERGDYPILPGMTQSTDEESELNLGTWEGNPLDMFAAAITGVDVEDVKLIGPGLVDGRAQEADWWVDCRTKRGAWRPRLLFLNRCRRVSVQGLHFRNSPAWNLHPYFSEDLAFLDISVSAPSHSPNTDGFDPESCRHVLLAGAHFSLGDDCIAIKSGKIYMGAHLKTPCEDLSVCHCLMENGHGGVTVGSEMAGGVKNVRVSHCLMRRTDRGLRVKTRRGRGKDGVIDDIVFDTVRMDHVGAPFVVNSLYFCDPDGRTEWVQSREKAPVDETTPRIGSIVFRRVRAENCAACAGYFLGLPEQPIESVLLEHASFTYDPEAEPFVPAMAMGVEPCKTRGIIAKFVNKITLRDVTIEGQTGEKLDMEAVTEMEWKDA